MMSSVSRVFCVVVIVGALASFAAASRADEAASGGGNVARGKYLVQGVGQCADCHGAQLQGQPLPFKPTIAMPWVGRTPKIAGLPMFTSDSAAVKFLQTGIDEHGHRARPPMPAYRLNREDARDVVAYLKTLGS